MVSHLRLKQCAPWSQVGRLAGGVRVSVEEVAPRVLRIQVSSRLSRQAGMPVSCYLVDDVLLDTGFSHAGEALLAALGRLRAGRPLRAIACTHHHEDHVGNAAAIARRAGGCPVFLARPEVRWSEGVGAMPAYRQVYWGPVAEYDPLPMPERLRFGRLLEVVATPGHSASHVVFHDPAAGIVFTGDLLVSSGASAIMTHESPAEIIASLRRVADLAPRLLLSGHGLRVADPAARLRRKADRMEEAAAQVRALSGQGLPLDEIARRVFRQGWGRERWGVFMTQGEFSRLNFVRAVLREARPSDAATDRVT